MRISENAKRYLKVMTAGMLINFACYLLAHYAHLPVWMDTVGTCYVAMVLEPVAGLLVGYLVNFFQAVFLYGKSTIIFYLVTAVSALTIGIFMRKDGKLDMKRLPRALAAFVVLASIMSTLIIFWQGGVSSSQWEQRIMYAVMEWGVPQPVGVFCGVFVLKIMDAVSMAIFLPLCYRLTPRKYINTHNPQTVSWKNSIFRKAED